MSEISEKNLEINNYWNFKETNIYGMIIDNIFRIYIRWTFKKVKWVFYFYTMGPFIILEQCSFIINIFTTVFLYVVFWKKHIFSLSSLDILLTDVNFREKICDTSLSHIVYFIKSHQYGKFITYYKFLNTSKLFIYFVMSLKNTVFLS